MSVPIDCELKIHSLVTDLVDRVFQICKAEPDIKIESVYEKLNVRSTKEKNAEVSHSELQVPKATTKPKANPRAKKIDAVEKVVIPLPAEGCIWQTKKESGLVYCAAPRVNGHHHCFKCLTCKTEKSLLNNAITHGLEFIAPSKHEIEVMKKEIQTKKDRVEERGEAKSQA